MAARDDPAVPAYDPMRQFAQLAGDVRDPYPMLADLRETTPVLKVSAQAPKLPTLYSVFPHEHVQQVLTDNVRFSSAGYATSMGQVMGRTILEMDPPEHQRHRALVAGAFRARMLHRWDDTVIGATISELISAFAGDGQADLIRQLTFPFPVRVISRILGLPEADWSHFLQLSTQLIAVMRDWDGALAASRELRGYFAQIIAGRRRNPGDDLVSQLIRAEADGQRLSDEQIYPFLLLLGGVAIPQGAFVSVSLGAANRDPRRYPRPDNFDIFRERRQHISFGAGPHTCLGMHLARLETRVLLNAVLDRLPGLRLNPAAHDTHIHGLVFRSPPELPVLFDPGRRHDR